LSVDCGDANIARMGGPEPESARAPREAVISLEELAARVRAALDEAAAAVAGGLEELRRPLS
jgi:hypothetical protein